MQPEGLDAVVTSSPENFAYLNGFVVPSQPLIRHRHAMSIVTADGKTALFAVDMEATTVRGRAPDMPLQIWAEFTDSAMAKLAGQLTGLGLAGATIGIEMDYLPAGDFAALSRLLPERALEAGRGVARPPAADQDRGTKSRCCAGSRASPTRRSPTRTPPCRPAAAKWTSPRQLTRGVYALGAEHFKLMIVATGERSQLPNVGPSRAQAAGARRVPGGDLFGHQRLPGRRVPHRSRRRSAGARRTHLGAPGGMQVHDHGHDQAGCQRARGVPTRSSPSWPK